MFTCDRTATPGTSPVGCSYAVGRLEVRGGIEVPGVLTGSAKARNYGHAAGRECMAHLPSSKIYKVGRGEVHDGIEAPGTLTDRTKLNCRAVGHGAGHISRWAFFFGRLVGIERWD